MTCLVQFTVMRLNLKLGIQKTRELAPEIPNVGEDATRDLDENGIIRIEARVSEGVVLIGRLL